jgi:hypothetical protein
MIELLDLEEDELAVCDVREELGIDDDDHYRKLIGINLENDIWESKL